MPDRDAVETIRRAARTARFLAVTSGMLALYEAHERLTPVAARAELWRGYRARYLDRVLGIFDVRLEIAPSVPPPRNDGARLVVSNHRSALDIAILIRHFGGSILSRGDVAQWPLLGRVARRAGTVFVDRSEEGKRASAARVVRRRLTEHDTITVFPEGTTFAGDEVRPFQAGIFAAARGLDVEIVPVGLAYESGAEYREKSFVEHLARTAGRKRTRVAMEVGRPFRLEGDTRREAERCREAVQQLVRSARARMEATTSRVPSERGG